MRGDGLLFLPSPPASRGRGVGGEGVLFTFRALQSLVPLMKYLRTIFPLALLSLVFLLPAFGQGKKPAPKATAEDDYYKILTFEPPPGTVLEAGALELLPDGKMALGT